MLSSIDEGIIFYATRLEESPMFARLHNPAWIDPRLLVNANVQNAPESIFDDIKNRIAKFNSATPEVSVIIPAYNEEYAILRTLHTLVHNETNYQVEIIVVNNNSTDRTQEVLDRLNVKSYFQPVPGWGPARQLGLEKALGKYILTADADCFYPPDWIQEMTAALNKDKVTCVYGGYSYLGTAEKARWKFFIYECLRNVILELRQIKRPYLNARGLNMGFLKELGLMKGYVYRKMRGEDGRMCYELMQFGKIVRLRSNKILVWTPPRTLKDDGGLFVTFLNNVLLEAHRFKGYFYTPPKHDTHTSANSPTPILKKSLRVKATDLKQKVDVGSNV